jgi:chromosome segregation ATPase
VKTELERAWSDWEERCRDIEEQKSLAEFRLQESENRLRDLSKQLQTAKRELKEIRELGDQSKQELKIVQRKYEEEIERKEAHIENIKQAK